MHNFMLATAVACLAAVSPSFADGARKGPDAKCLDGAWTVVCYVKNGEPQAEAKGMTVKAEAGTITCSGKDGKAAVTMKVVLGPNGTVRVTEVGGDNSAGGGTARPGVYVLTTDMLAISLNTDAAPAGTVSAPGDAANKSRCSLVLKRESAK